MHDALRAQAMPSRRTVRSTLGDGLAERDWLDAAMAVVGDALAPDAIRVADAAQLRLDRRANCSAQRLERPNVGGLFTTYAGSESASSSRPPFPCRPR